MKEIWKEINGYKISNYGNIIGRKGKLLSQTPDKNGYLGCTIDLGDPYGKVYNQHRAVAFAFLYDYYKEGYEINHIDANKINNRVDNLEWVTHQDNMNHVSSNGLHGKTTPCCEIDSNGEIIKIYLGLRRCSKIIDVKYESIYQCCIGNQDMGNGKRMRFYSETTNDYIHTKFDEKDFSWKHTKRQKIKCVETGQIFKSQMDASRHLKINQSRISMHLKGEIRDVNGYTFIEV